MIAFSNCLKLSNVSLAYCIEVLNIRQCNQWLYNHTKKMTMCQERDGVNRFRLIQKSIKNLCDIKLLVISKAHVHAYVCLLVCVCVASSSNTFRIHYKYYSNNVQYCNKKCHNN